ncbi:hypothetical protein HXX76_013209 [Chlamydomonas incerta]|uniref:Uncharacterized protein n=1 Tax=Chlamydomonas incerta TaxID=51695 RepID=A0A835ST97_CHLIN|nr:hypothetical protein HXX76_013209 [Chlamydomonas incerta]|eukprot:KAG2426230.1 hypothetical protein HXX76_013209 [Chlamydomonas incerta]
MHVALQPWAGHEFVPWWIWAERSSGLRLCQAFGWESHKRVAAAACGGRQVHVLTWLESGLQPTPPADTAGVGV